MSINDGKGIEITGEGEAAAGEDGMTPPASPPEGGSLGAGAEATRDSHACREWPVGFESAIRRELLTGRLSNRGIQRRLIDIARVADAQAAVLNAARLVPVPLRGEVS